MTDYVLIASRNRLEAADATHCFDLAEDLAASGHTVTVFMVQNGVLTARGGAVTLDAAAAAGVRLLADQFSLHERGISDGQIHNSVLISPLDFVVDRLAAGDKVIWH